LRMEILKLVNCNRHMEMAVIFPVPHVKFGEIAGCWGNQPKDPLFIFNGIPIQWLLLKTEFHQLRFIESYRKNVLRGIPEFLDTIIYKSHVFFAISLYNSSFTHQAFIIYHYNIAALQLTKFYHIARF